MTSPVDLSQLMEMLKEIRQVDALEAGGNSADLEAKLRKGRAAMIHIIGQIMADVTKVTDNLERKRAGACDTVLQYIAHCVQHLPLLFIPPGHGADSQKHSQHKNEEKFCQAMIVWIVGKLLSVLACPPCAALHENALLAVTRLLALVKLKDPHGCNLILADLIMCLGDAVQAFEKFYDNNGDYSWTVKQLGGQNEALSFGDCHLTFTPLVVDSVEGCETLQGAVTKVVTSLVGGAWLTDLRMYDVLWATLACQLDNGGVMLKQLSLSAMRRLLSQHDLPSAMVLDYVMSTLNAMFHFLVNDKDVIPDGLPLELEFGRLYASVLRVSTVPTCCTRVERGHLMEGLEELVGAVGGHGTQAYSQDMWACLDEILTLTYRLLSAELVRSGTVPALRRRLAEALVTDVGMVENAQYLIPSLCRETKFDLDLCPSNHLTDVCPRDYRTKHVAETLDTRLTTFLEDCLRPVDKNKTIHIKNLEGIRIITEVFVSLCRGKNAENSNDAVHRLTLGAVFSVDQVSALTACVRSILSQTASLPSEILSSAYKAILEILAVFLCSDFAYVAPAAKTYMWCVLSLPWMAQDVSWIDLKPSDAKEMGKLANAISEKIDVSCRCVSIKALALLPKEYCPQWRKRVIQIAVASESEDLIKTVVECFPLMLFKFGPNANHLVYDCLHKLITNKSGEVKKTLARIIGLLACIIARKCDTEVVVEETGMRVYEGVQIRCCDCDGRNKSDEKSFKPKSVDAAMFLPFVKLQSPDLNLDLAIGLQRIFTHIRTNSPSSMELWEKCLPLLEDPNYDVRLYFSKIMAFVVSEQGSSEADETVMVKLKEAMVRAKKTNLQLEETVLLSIAEFGKAAQEQTTSVVIPCLLGSLIQSTPTISALAFDQIRRLSSANYPKHQTMFMEHRMVVCKFVAEVMYDLQSNTRNSRNSPIDALKLVAKVFDFSDIKSFLKAAEPYLIPHLITKATQVSAQLIKLLAKEQNINYKGLLMYSTRYIFCYMVVQTESPELDKALSFFINETREDLNQLLRMYLHSIFNELTSHLSSGYTRVFHALKQLAPLEKKDAKVPKSTEEMADFLQPRLLGILAAFDNQLLSNSIPKNEKQRALRSLISIINLMGTKHVTSVRVKIMTTLKLGLRFKDPGFVEINCKAWKCFVRSVEFTSLGPMLPQIIVALLPLLKEQPSQVAEIFNYLIVQNKKELQQHFDELYFLPDIPELKSVNAVLQKHWKTKEGSDLKSQIETLLKGLGHEGLDVRVHAVTKMKRLLLENQTKLHEYILENETADPVIGQLAGALLSGCRETDEKARALFGECLGVLGAVDPGRMTITERRTSVKEKFQSSVKDEGFDLNLISELARDFLAAEDTRTQDCTAFAIQQLLQIYEVSDQSDNSLWRQFPEHVREILTPLLTSRYICSSPDWSNLTKPIYMSRKGSTYKDWVCTWAGYLVSRVQDSLAKRVFQACGPVIKHSVHIAVYLLPYIVTQTLFDTRDIADELTTEILAVLNSISKIDVQQGSVSDFKHLSAQTVFSVMDYITKWNRNRIESLSHQGRSGTSSSEPVYEDDLQYRCLKQFLEKIPQDLLAYASFNCKANTRAIMHCEMYMNLKKGHVQESLDFLQKLYAAMDEPDGVAGCTAIRQGQHSITEQILAHRSVGKLHDASACYERAVQQTQDDLALYQGQLSCMNELGLYSATMVHVNGLVNHRPEWESDLNALRVEACWQLGKWDDLNHYVKKEGDRSSWSVGLGRILLAGKEKNSREFYRSLEVLRTEQMGPLSAASMEAGSYQRGYDYIVKLHILNEVEESLSGLFELTEENDQERTERLMRGWEQRIEYVQASVRQLQPVLNVRRAVMGILMDDDDQISPHIGRSYLHSAKVARKAGHLQTAYSFLLNAEDFHLPEVFLEKAKWLWAKNDNDVAISLLERGIESHFSGLERVAPTGKSDSEHLQCARAMLLLARYSEETSSVETNQVMKLYRDVINMAPDWESGYFHTAKYYDKLMTTLVDSDAKKGQFIMHVLVNFGKSLQFGNIYIYQSMPRMLSLWLDYGAKVVEDEKKPAKNKQSSLSQAQSARGVLSTLNKYISDFIDRLPEYQFLTALPQLISRICHADQEVFTALMGIICKVLCAYPQQSMWLLMAVSKSSYPMRVQRCLEIFTRAKQSDRKLNKYLTDATKLVDQLLDLCNRDVKKPTDSLSMAQHFSKLKRLVEGSEFSQILLPLQALMTVTLPTGHHEHHNAFPGTAVHLAGFDDTIEVMNSLQRPKKFTMRGTDGHKYVMMCKPKDDLRKDCRLMEFNGLVNRCLRKDPEARKRQLYIRTYAVIPLNEECGLLEWVPNTFGFRHIITKIYRERRILMTPKEMKSCAPAHGASLDNKLMAFKTKFLPRHPPVFKEWFLRMFPDPTSWYTAHLSYSRTCAVMSMIGYILGLGDRHGENILFDATNGDCVHVDFNCLFNRGESFEWPELVPFRLTHNMVDAMGPMGCEGIYRRACEVTIRVMRNERDPLMSVLKTFIYDPLCEWSKSTRPHATDNRTKADSGEIKNEMAQTHVQKIEHRIKGILRASKARGLPLSVEGHVNHLISEATDVNNLCRMYIGWTAFI